LNNQITLITNLENLQEAAEKITAFGRDIKVWLFYGEMGAGKTTLIKSICSALGVQDTVSSPTFSIINEYHGNSNPVYHFDFYRLKNQHEAMDMGYEDYFYSGNHCLVEWPEKIPDLLPAEYLSLQIGIIDTAHREIIVSLHQD
jgi:tRNA threonylcarbamoyladenosine biosynthesis protein TsaE